MPSILISNIGFGRASPQALATLKQYGFVIENSANKRFEEADFVEKLSEAQVVIAGTEPISAVALKNAPNLKLIARVGVGVDNIDMKAAAEKKINIIYTPEAPSLSVPEFTLSLILSLLKGTHISDRKLRESQWFRPQGRMLSSVVCGVVGAGKIGKEVIRLIRGISTEATILFYDPFVEKVNHAHKVTMDQLVREADVISLHLPLNSQTRNLINEAFLRKMKKEAYLINTSRGAIVDESAVYEALKSGHLGGAAFDVFEEEPYSGKLIQLENCLLTSHIGSMTKEVRSLMEEQVVEDIIRFFDKKPLLRPLEGFDFGETP